MKYYLAFDPGKTGGVIIIDGDGNVVLKETMPIIKGKKSKSELDIPRILEIIKKYKSDNLMAIIEKQTSMPLQGVSSTFTTGKNFGILIGIITALNVKHVIIHAKTWQNIILKDIDRTDTKQASILVARRLFPNIDFRATERCTTYHNGLTDAACMAEYIRILYK